MSVHEDLLGALIVCGPGRI